MKQMAAIAQPAPVCLLILLGFLAFIGRLFRSFAVLRLFRIRLKLFQELGGSPDLILLGNPNTVTGILFMLDLVWDSFDKKKVSKNLRSALVRQVPNQSHVRSA